MNRAKTLLLSFSVLTFALAAPATAQSSQVKNTGCPNAAYPSISATKVGRSATVTFPAMKTTDIPFIVLGWSSGGGISLQKPFTCVNNCVLYVALPAFYMAPLPAGTKTFTFTVPNDPRLFQTCYSVQTASVTPSLGCVDLHGAVSFCIGK